MIPLNKIAAYENYFAQAFTNYKSTPYYIAYYNDENKESWDSNHAIIFKYDERFEEHLDAITTIYTERDIVPRFYNAYVKDDVAAIQKLFIRKGYTFELNENRLFYRSGRIVLDNLPMLKIRQIKHYCEDIDMMLSDTPWSKGVVKNSIGAEQYRFFIGYVDSKPVTSASVRLVNGLTRLDDVKTPLEYRGRRYCQSLLNSILNDESISRYTNQYLYASEKDAIHIYEKLGYVEHSEKITFWTAWR